MHLSEIEDLTYRRLLDWYYLHESPIPLDLNEVSRQIRMRTHSDCIATVLLEFFERTADGWIHHRANKEIEKVGDKSQKASASAKARWNKVNDANALQMQSDGNATHNTLPITQDTEHKTQKKATVVACPQDVNQQVWNDWLQLRKTKKASVTETVIRGARNEASKIGWTREQFLVEWCTRGSQGLKAEWLKEKLSVSEQRQNTMSQLTRGMSVPKQPFWAKPETIVLEAEDVERKRLL